jgi:hypothetical protein
MGGRKSYFCNTFIKLRCIFLSNHKFSTIIELCIYIVQNSLRLQTFVFMTYLYICVSKFEARAVLTTIRVRNFCLLVGCLKT